MSNPRDGFDDRDDGSGWREPAHLSDADADGGGRDADGRQAEGWDAGGRDGAGNGPAGPGIGDPDGPNFADRRMRPRDDQWPPPGWDLPPAEERTPSGEWEGRAGGPDPAKGPDSGGPGAARAGDDEAYADRGDVNADRGGVFADQGDLVGTQGWALQYGWTISDGSAAEDAPLRDLVASAPVSRVSKDHRPAGVVRGRADALDLVAFDVVYASGRYLVPQYAVTAAPLLVPVPSFRLTPARFWKHRTGGLLHIATGDPAFDSRWVLLSAEDTPGVRALAQDAAIRGLLLGTDDGDEFWSAAGFVAAIRPDGHRPLLIEHHARLLGAVVRAVVSAL